MKIENTHFSVELTDTLELILRDHVNGSEWRSEDPFRIVYGHSCSYSLREHARNRITQTDRTMSIVFDQLVYWSRFPENQYRRPENGPDLRFHFKIQLDIDRVVFRIESVEGLDHEDCEVIFPHGLLRFSSAQTVQCPLPLGFGVLLNFPCTERSDWHYSYAPANMPIFGILPADSGGVALYLKDYCDQKTHVAVNRIPGEASFQVEYLFHEGIADDPRELHLYGMPHGSDYNHLAKWYRGIVQGEGRFVTLREKIRTSPDVEKLVGAVIWKHDVYSVRTPPKEHSYSYFVMRPEEAVYEKKSANWSAYEVFDTAKENGFDRVCIYNMGWNHGGFDSMYPTRFPPNPERGSIEEFRDAAEYGRSLSPDFIYSVHDNYYECYRNSQEFDESEMAYTPSGSVKNGYIWRGGRSALLCTSFSMKYARRDLPKIQKMLGKGSIYLDVFGSARSVNCAHPEHPLGEREDLQNRRDVFAYAKSVMGSLATEQQPNDYCVDIVDLGAFGPLGPESSYCGGIPLIPIPLWQLVYHDVVLNYMAESSGYGSFGDEYMAFVALYGMLPTAFDEVNRSISYGMRSAYLEEMKKHEFLTPPVFGKDHRLHAAARSVFADGTEVVANFNSEPYSWNGHEIGCNRFLIIKA